MVLSALILGLVASQPSGNQGLNLNVNSSNIREVVLGVNFETTVSRTEDGKDIPVAASNWRTLTPDLCEVIDSSRGVFRPLRPGMAVLQAQVFLKIERRNGVDYPIFESFVSPVKIRPLIGFRLSEVPALSIVGASYPISAIAFRDSNQDLNKDKDNKNGKPTAEESVRISNEYDRLLSDTRFLGMNVTTQRDGSAESGTAEPSRPTTADQLAEFKRKLATAYLESMSSAFSVKAADALALSPSLQRIYGGLSQCSKDVLNCKLGKKSIRDLEDLVVVDNTTSGIDPKCEESNEIFVYDAKERDMLRAILAELRQLSNPSALRSTGVLSKLLAGLPVTVRSLNPDLVVLSSGKDAPTGELVVPNGSSFSLVPVKSGSAKIIAECGGSVFESSIDVVAPEVSIAVVAEQDRKLRTTISMKDKGTGKLVPLDGLPLGHVQVRYRLNGVLQNTQVVGDSWSDVTANGIRTISTGKITPGEHLVDAVLVVAGRSISTASGKSSVRDCVETVAAPGGISIIFGDSTPIPLSFLAKGKKISDIGIAETVIEYEDYRSNGLSPESRYVAAAVVPGKEGLQLDVTGLRPGRATIFVSVKNEGQKGRIVVDVRPQLVVTSARVVGREVADLFGEQYEREFIVRRLTFTNNLDQVKTNIEIKGKDIQVYGNSMFCNVVIARSGYKISAGDRQTLRELVAARSSGEGTDLATRSEASLNRKLDEVLAGANGVAIQSYNPVLNEQITKMKGAIESRRSEESLRRTFGIINDVTTFLGEVGDLRQLGLRITFGGSSFARPFGLIANSLEIKNPQNPFEGDRANSTRALIQALVGKLISNGEDVRNKKGQALDANHVLGETLSVSASAPSKRYVFIPRASFRTTGRTQVQIHDFWDEEFLIGYNIITTASATATGTAGAAPVAPAGRAPQPTTD